MSRMSAGATVIALVSLLSPSPAAAALVRGTARTTDGLPAARVALTFVAQQARTETTVHTQGRGVFEADLAPGRYVVRPHAGFVVTEPASIDVPDSAGASAPLTIDVVLGPASIREDIVVAASRAPMSRSSLGVATTVLDAEDLRARAASSVSDLLLSVPGFAIGRSGGVGPVAAAFLRGGESRFARVLVDGVPVNEPGGYFNFGTLLAGDLSRVEVVRGSVSTLYGSDALAGVVDLRPRETEGAFGSVEGGSFETRAGSLSLGRSFGPVALFATGNSYETDNEQPNGAFESRAFRFGASRPGVTSARAFAWRQSTEGGVPGATLYGRADLDARYERDLTVAGFELGRTRGSFRHLARFSVKHDDQLSINPADSGSYTPAFDGRRAPFAFSDFPNPLGYVNETTRLNGTLQTEASRGAHLVIAGVDVERETGEVGDLRTPATLVEPERTNAGVFVQDQWRAANRLFVTAGVRAERKELSGTVVVPRASFAWQAVSKPDAEIAFRASGGEGIKDPSFLESYGKQSFAVGNPDLEPERSRTFDAGVDARLFGRARFEATLFHHTYRDHIAYKALPNFAGTYENLPKTRSRGVELAAEIAIGPNVRVHGQYTRTDAEILESASASGANAPGQPLLRRPKNQGSATVEFRRARLFAAATAIRVGERPDSDFSGLGFTTNAAYTRVDLRARFAVSDAVSISAVLENAADREYQEILGYRALGRRARVSIAYAPPK